MKTLKLLIPFLLLVSCTSIDPERVHKDNNASFTFKAKVSWSDNESKDGNSFQSKSYFNKDYTKIGIYYKDNGRLAFSGNLEDLVGLNKYFKYNYYLLTGELSLIEMPQKEQELKDIIFYYKYPEQEYNYYSIDNSTIPMYGYILNSTPNEADISDGSKDNAITFNSTYLFSKINLTVEFDENFKKHMVPFSVKVSVKNIAGSVAPFNSLYKNQKFFKDTGAYIITTEKNHKYTLYIPENLQGTINANPWEYNNKTPATLRENGKIESHCTYIEVTVNYITNYGVLGDVIYRFYPGKDNYASLDIVRNYENDIKLVIKHKDRIAKDHWKINKSKLYDNRAIDINKNYIEIKRNRKDNFNVFFAYDTSVSSHGSTGGYNNPTGWNISYNHLDARNNGINIIEYGIIPYKPGTNQNRNEFRFIVKIDKNATKGFMLPIIVQTFDGIIKKEVKIKII